MLELDEQERQDVTEAIAIRLMELKGYILSPHYSSVWRLSPGFQSAMIEAEAVLEIVIEYSRNQEVGYEEMAQV